MSEILTNWENGLGLPGVMVIDGHTHICPWHWPLQVFDPRTVETAAQTAAALMDANGVDACCALPTGYYHTGSDYRLGNDFLLAVAEMLPERVVPFPNVNPNDAHPNVMAELGRVYDAGARCLKLLNSYQERYPDDGPNLMAVYEFAEERHLLILNHAWTCEALWRLSEKFPNVTFICGHYGSGQDPILRERENVYANIWSYPSRGAFDRGFANVGAHKFLFGSDAFMNPMSVGIGPVVYAPISDQEKRQILGLTMARLLDEVGALPGVLKDQGRS